MACSRGGWGDVCVDFTNWIVDTSERYQITLFRVLKRNSLVKSDLLAEIEHNKSCSSGGAKHGRRSSSNQIVVCGFISFARAQAKLKVFRLKHLNLFVLTSRKSGWNYENVKQLHSSNVGKRGPKRTNEKYVDSCDCGKFSSMNVEVFVNGHAITTNQGTNFNGSTVHEVSTMHTMANWHLWECRLRNYASPCNYTSTSGHFNFSGRPFSSLTELYFRDGL